MSYAPGYAEIVPPMVGPFTLGWSLYAWERVQGVEASSQGFDADNQANYYPILVPTTCIVRRLWWINGASVSGSYNVDCGVYADNGVKPGTRLVSAGSTAQGTASNVQFVDVTDLTLPPGRYWIALAASTTSATFFRTSVGVQADASWLYTQSSALPLPSSATPAEAASSGVFVCGFATTASP